MKKTSSDRSLFLRIVLLLYCLAMLYLLFFRSIDGTNGLSYGEQLRANSNLIPFYTIRNYLYVIIHKSNPALIQHGLVNLLGNVVLFVPAGILLPLNFFKQHRFFRFFLTWTGIILAVETLQLFTLLGSFDVDDIILNLTGMLLGYVLWAIFLRKHL